MTILTPSTDPMLSSLVSVRKVRLMNNLTETMYVILSAIHQAASLSCLNVDLDSHKSMDMDVLSLGWFKEVSFEPHCILGFMVLGDL